MVNVYYANSICIDNQYPGDYADETKKRLHVLRPITLLEAAKGKSWQPTLPPIRVSRG